tara:strand:+ start:734 stop:2092 length:1359 start_codon:yes stop_codon:yes gene_type:complete
MINILSTKQVLHTAIFVATTLLSGQALAAVSATEAAKLGTSLTPVGAVKAANADGSIPAWTGGLTQPISHGDNPFAGEKPLFTITAANLDQHASMLTPGQVALFKAYPDSYRIPVYPSHRTGAYPQSVYDKAIKNATRAELTTNALANYEEAIPFAIPQNGLEVVWNHITRYRGGAAKRKLMQAPVQRNGSYTAVKLVDEFIFPQYMADGYDAAQDANILFYFKQEITEPARLVGTTLLVHETIDQVVQPRMAWIYNSGQRRVRRAPQVAYDGPGTASDSLRTSDNFDMFNGSPDKYNWTLLGKQEMYIPYNAFELGSPRHKYDEIIRAGHINPDLTRYEKHRVWVVEGTLKEGERHIYAKRTLYVDEDTWQIAVADHYDGRGQLWRVGEAHATQYTEATVPWYSAEILHDLQSGRYLALGLTNEEKDAVTFGFEGRHKDYTPAALRRDSKR